MVSVPVSLVIPVSPLSPVRALSALSVKSAQTFSCYWSHPILNWYHVLKLCPISPLCPLSPLSHVAHPPASGACFLWTGQLNCRSGCFFPVKCNFSSPSSLFSAIGEEQLILLEMESDFSEVALASELIKKDFQLRTLMPIWSACGQKMGEASYALCRVGWLDALSDVVSSNILRSRKSKASSGLIWAAVKYEQGNVHLNTALIVLG